MNTSEPNSKNPNGSESQIQSQDIQVEVPRPTHEEIATMAYFIWLSEGCPEGCAERHWYEAEAQLIKTRQADAIEKLLELQKTQASAKSAQESQKPEEKTQTQSDSEKVTRVKSVTGAKKQSKKTNHRAQPRA